MGEQLVAQPEPARPGLVAVGAVGHQAGDGRAGLGETERDALAREGVDVAGGVADEQDAARGRRRGPAGAADRRPSPGSGRRSSRSCEHGEVGEQVLEPRPGVAEDGDPDEVVGDRRDVGLRAGRPVHLDVRRPRRLRDVAAQPEPAARPGAGRRARAAGGRGSAARRRRAGSERARRRPAPGRRAGARPPPLAARRGCRRPRLPRRGRRGARSGVRRVPGRRAKRAVAPTPRPAESR